MSSPPQLMPLLRRAAPRLSKHLFPARDCRRAISHFPKHTPSHPTEYRARSQTPFLQAFRTPSRAQSTTSSLPTRNVFGSTSHDAGEAAVSAPEGTANAKDRTKASSFPETSSRSVGIWLLGSAVSVFGIVVFGGLTRLTESGLSITEWRPVTGTVPPLNDADWTVEYDKYRASPEFKKLNPNMTMEEFKRIFWMEYLHRLWGRVIGFTVLFPTIYFIARRRVSKPMMRNILLINGLIVTQGFVGWWMVKSGLKDDLFATHAHPRVSQYRLMTHLGLAFTVYVSMVWNGLQILRETRLNRMQPQAAEQLLARLSSSPLRPFRIATALISGLVFTTAMSGALVAGLDAGLIYNEFPYMGLGLTPPRAELWDAFYSRLPAPHADLWWRNILENPSLVQLDHRILAVSTFTAVNALWMYARSSPAVQNTLTKGAWRALHGSLGLVWMQAALGLTTLLYLVPTPVAAAHQAGALALLTGVTVLGGRVFVFRGLANRIRARVVNQSRLDAAMRAHNLRTTVRADKS